MYSKIAWKFEWFSILSGFSQKEDFIIVCDKENASEQSRVEQSCNCALAVPYGHEALETEYHIRDE